MTSREPTVRSGLSFVCGNVRKRERERDVEKKRKFICLFTGLNKFARYTFGREKSSARKISFRFASPKVALSWGMIVR